MCVCVCVLTASVFLCLYKFKPENSLMRSLELSDLHPITKSFFSALDAVLDETEPEDTEQNTVKQQDARLHVFVRIFYLWSISLVIRAYLMSMCINTKAMTKPGPFVDEKVELNPSDYSRLQYTGMVEWEIIAER